MDKDIRVIYQEKNYRIVEVYDDCCSLEDLMGDTYNAEANPDIPIEQLNKEREVFINKVNQEGVYGYVLEVWNPEVDRGWQHVDSCWGFVGLHEDEKHYIVQEFIDQISKLLKEEE